MRGRPADLVALAEDGSGSRPMPTHAEFLDRVRVVCPCSSLRTYATGFNRLVPAFADLPVNRVSGGDVQVLAATTLASVRSAGHQDGTGAVRTLLHSARFFYKTAVRDGLIRENPALAVELPARHRSVRRALTETALGELYEVVAATGNDPVLDLSAGLQSDPGHEHAPAPR